MLKCWCKKCGKRLKTLKDIGLETCILKRELREEAIKWVKELDLDYEKRNTIGSWITHFFNIL